MFLVRVSHQGSILGILYKYQQSHEQGLMPENKWRAPRKDNNNFNTPSAPAVSSLPRLSLGGPRLSVGSNAQIISRQSLGPGALSGDFASLGISADAPRYSLGVSRQSIENRASLRRYII